MSNDKRVFEVFDAGKIESATETVQKFLSLFPQDRVLSPVELAFISEAVNTAVKAAFK